MSDFCDRCRGCPVERDGGVSRPEPKEVAIVLDYPTSIEVGRDKLISGDSGLLLKKVLLSHGIRVEDCYVTTALNCRPQVNKEAMLKKAMLSCRDRLLYELKAAGVRKVLSVGTMGYSALSRADKNLSITKVRGKWYNHFGMMILPTVPLPMTSRNWTKRSTSSRGRPSSHWTSSRLGSLPYATASLLWAWAC
jgi:uracil-DNA glycosylase family 4